MYKIEKGPPEMALIKPFKAFYYNLDVVKDFSNVVTQPFDEITLRMEEEYRKRSPFNAVRIIKGDFNDTKRVLNEWIKKGVFVQETEESIYAYDRIYSLRGELKVQKGFIALGRLSPYNTGIIRPHEKTFPDAVKLQFDFLKSTHAHLGPIFTLYKDESYSVESLIEPFKKVSPVIEAEDWYGNIHKIWRISDLKVISKVQKIMKDKYLIIADGHHRYEASLRYAEYNNFDEVFSFRMMAFVNVYPRENISILPIYRLVSVSNMDDFSRKLNSIFYLYKKPLEDLEQRLYPDEEDFAIYLGNNYYFVLKKKQQSFDEISFKGVPKEFRNLSTVVLEKLILPLIDVDNSMISYETNLKRAIKEAKESKKILFILKPPTIEQIDNITKAGLLMPEKSTNFYPKLLNGLLLNRFEEDISLKKSEIYVEESSLREI